MLTNGFYTKLPSWLQWVTYLSVPRYTFVAMLKLEYSWRDIFEVDPMRGNSGVSFPSKYVTAELTGVFQAMTERNMGIMLSPGDSSPRGEFIVMLSFIFILLVIIVIAVKDKAIDIVDREMAKNYPEALEVYEIYTGVNQADEMIASGATGRKSMMNMGKKNRGPTLLTGQAPNSKQTSDKQVKDASAVTSCSAGSSLGLDDIEAEITSKLDEDNYSNDTMSISQSSEPPERAFLLQAGPRQGSSEAIELVVTPQLDEDCSEHDLDTVLQSDSPEEAIRRVAGTLTRGTQVERAMRAMQRVRCAASVCKPEENGVVCVLGIQLGPDVEALETSIVPVEELEEEFAI